MRHLLNTIQIAAHAAIILSDNETTIPIIFNITASFSAGDEFEVELYRDSLGIDDGGLETHLSTLGWGSSPSASLRVNKFT